MRKSAACGRVSVFMALFPRTGPTGGHVVSDPDEPDRAGGGDEMIHGIPSDVRAA